MTVKVIISGAKGKMGSVTKQAIASEADLLLVADVDRGDNLSQRIADTKADVVIDFTTPDAVFANAKAIIKAKARPVIGTTGMSRAEIEELSTLCQREKIGGIVAPNFSLGAILMMRYAKDAAQYFNAVEIIELHHPQKKDAPSGTAKKTAEMIEEAQQQSHSIPIHSVRLPGLFAHQMVIFGGNGETLTLRHDSMDRSTFMPGVFLACRKVMTIDHLIYGLENVL